MFIKYSNQYFIGTYAIFICLKIVHNFLEVVNNLFINNSLIIFGTDYKHVFSL